MVPRIALVAAGAGAVVAAAIAWVGGTAAAVFSFLGSGMLLAMLYGQAGSSAGSMADFGEGSGEADMTEQDSGSTRFGRENSGLELGLGLTIFTLGGFFAASLTAIVAHVVA